MQITPIYKMNEKVFCAGGAVLPHRRNYISKIFCSLFCCSINHFIIDVPFGSIESNLIQEFQKKWWKS